MIAEIVAIGTELLMGQIADSDAQMLSRELQSLGIAVYHHQVVGDNPQRMREALALALEDFRRRQTETVLMTELQ